MLFQNRREAGGKLAQALKKYKNSPRTIILGLPRGGVVVAAEAAKILNLPLDIIVPRKIGAPGNSELAIGAIGEEGEGVFNQELINYFGISLKYIKTETAKEKSEAERRLKLYRGDKPPLNLKGATTILVDDGLATGATMLAAIKSARLKGAEKVIVAVPVSPPDTLEKIQSAADEVICLAAPSFFGAVGNFYQEFGQVEDEEVIKILHGKSK